jgi:hypothetical protein
MVRRRREFTKAKCHIAFLGVAAFLSGGGGGGLCLFFPWDIARPKFDFGASRILVLRGVMHACFGLLLWFWGIALDTYLPWSE